MTSLKINKLVVFTLSLLLAIMVACLYYMSNNINKKDLSIVLFLDVIAMIVFFLRKEQNILLKKQYIRIMPLFLIGFMIVHFQVYVEYIVGNYESWGVDYLIDKSVVIKSSIISSIALIAFLLGYSLEKKSNVSQSVTKNTIYRVSGLILLSYILFFVFIITVNRSFFNAGASVAEHGMVTEHANRFLIASIVGVIIINTRNQYVLKSKIRTIYSYIKTYNKWFLGLISIYCFLILLSGDRGPVIQIFISLLGGYILISNVKYKIYVFIPLIIVFANLMSLIAYIRVLENTDSYFEKIEKAQVNRELSSRAVSVSPSTVELAGSVRTLHAAVSYTEYNGYTHGVFQSYQLLGVIPGIGLIFNEMFNFERKEVSSSTFLTYQILGPNPTHGLGTSAVADIYLDFGWIGTLILFFVFGYIIRSLELSVFNKNILPSLFIMMIYFVLLMYSIYIGRSTIIVLPRNIVNFFVIIFIGFYVTRVFYPNFKYHIPV